MRTPFILVNSKAYPEVLGAKALDLARACAKVEEDTGRSLAVRSLGRAIPLRGIAADELRGKPSNTASVNRKYDLGV